MSRVHSRLGLTSGRCLIRLVDYVTHVSPTLLINAGVSSDNLKFQVQQTIGIRKFKTASECS